MAGIDSFFIDTPGNRNSHLKKSARLVELKCVTPRARRKKIKLQLFHYFQTIAYYAILLKSQSFFIPAFKTIVLPGFEIYGLAEVECHGVAGSKALPSGVN
jgi:hypothetical protein